jgi:hypothetical protein
MSMSKKDFEELAHAIKMSPADRDTFIDMIVDLCARSNPCFDEKRFRIASGQTYRDCCEEWTFTFPAGQWNDNIERYENCNCIEVNDDEPRCPVCLFQEDGRTECWAHCPQQMVVNYKEE